MAKRRKMILKCIESGEEIHFSYISRQLQENTLQKTYEIVSFEGKVRYKMSAGMRKSSHVSVGNYIEQCKKATRACIKILEAQPYNALDFNRNMFCPYHENKRTSKTPSARLYVKTNTIHCFSKRCNKTTNSISLLRYLNSLSGRK